MGVMLAVRRAFHEKGLQSRLPRIHTLYTSEPKTFEGGQHRNNGNAVHSRRSWRYQGADASLTAAAAAALRYESVALCKSGKKTSPSQSVLNRLLLHQGIIFSSSILLYKYLCSPSHPDASKMLTMTVSILATQGEIN